MIPLEQNPGNASPFDYLEQRLRREQESPVSRPVDETVDLESRFVFPADPLRELSPYDRLS